MRVAIVTESFLPSVNGVTTTVQRVLEHLRDRGHAARLIAPAPAGADRLRSYADAPITWLPSTPLPGYPSFRVSAPGPLRLARVLRDWRPDVVHLASPFLAGWDAVRAANHLGLPCVSVFQTDVPAFALRYGLGLAEPLLWRRVCNVHVRSARTLAPSVCSLGQLRDRGVPRLHLWRRGVDTELFGPHRRRAAVRAGLLRAAGGPGAEGDLLVGYVGRLAPEKQVEDLRVLAGLPGVRVVVVGDGPARRRLSQALPGAVFTGLRRGVELAQLTASLDVMVHPGENDTFGQTIQEAMASAVPVVAVARGGPVDLVQDGVTGLLYPPGELAGLRAAVAQLAASPAIRQRMGGAGHRAVAGRTWAAVGDQVIAHYRAVTEVSRLAAA